MKTIREDIQVERIEPDLIIIRHECILDDGFGGPVDMSDDMVFGSNFRAWVTEHFERGAEDDQPDIETDFPPDHLKVFVSGGQRIPDDIYVNLHNHREETAPHGKLYCLTLNPERARELVDKLRAL